MGQYITQDELGGILAQAQEQGLEPGKVVQHLVEQGADIEGFGQHAIASQPQAEAKPQFVDTESFAGNPVFEAIGKAGNAVAKKISEGADTTAEIAGAKLPGPLAKAVDVPLAMAHTAATLMLPRDADSAGMLALLPKVEDNPAEVGPTIRPSVTKPNAFEKLKGSAVTATTAVPERYSQAVAADPSILDTKDTPQSLSKEYQATFDKLGLKFDSDFVKKITGKRYLPNETQTEQGYKIIDGLLSKMEGQEPGQLPPNEAFLGRSVAASLKRSDKYLRNGTFKQVVDGAQNAFDNELEAQGVPEFKDLGVRYFKAMAKQHFDSWLPQNKNLSPNALRSLAMFGLAGSAVGHTLEGALIGAGVDAARAAAMSPKLAGLALKASQGPTVTNGAVNAALWASLMAKNGLKDEDSKP